MAWIFLGERSHKRAGGALTSIWKRLKKLILEASADDALTAYAEKLSIALEQLEKITEHLLAVKEKKGVEIFLSDANLYLEYFGIITIAWQWLLQGVAIQKAFKKGCSKKDIRFYQGKIFTMKYFFEYELPKTAGLLQRLYHNDGLTVEMDSALFFD